MTTNHVHGPKFPKTDILWAATTIAMGNQFKIAAAAILNLVLGHNLGVDQNFCTKFGTLMDNEQLKVGGS